MNVREFFWPVLEVDTGIEAAQRAVRDRSDVESIKSARIARDVDTLIEEARRLSDAEIDRRKSAEARGTTYLTAVGALATILLALAPAALDSKDGLAQPLVTLALFILAGNYLFFAGRWALRSLEVSTSARLDATDLVSLWRAPGRKEALAKGLLLCVRLDRRAVNGKVTCMKMAHAFVVRAFAILLLAVLVKFSWDPVAGLLGAIS